MHNVGMSKEFLKAIKAPSSVNSEQERKRINTEALIALCGLIEAIVGPLNGLMDYSHNIDTHSLYQQALKIQSDLGDDPSIARLNAETWMRRQA